MSKPFKRDTELQESSFFHWRYLPRGRRGVSPVDPLALLDLLLLLGLFFFAQSSLVQRPVVPLELPRAPFLAGAPYTDLVVTISRENMIFFQDERTTMAGLRAAFAQAAYKQPDAGLVVEADGKVSYQTLLGVYQMAIEAGIDEVALATGLPQEETWEDAR